MCGAIGAITLVALSNPTPVRAQRVSIVVDAGPSLVRYDGYQPSLAASLSPSIRLDRPWGALGARATYLVFESGRQSVSGSAGGTAFARVAGPVRAEFSATMGGSVYAGSTVFGHLLNRGRLFVASGTGGAWAGGTLGALRAESDVALSHSSGAGAWGDVGPVNTALSVTRSRVGSEVRYTDAEGAVRWSRRRIELDGSAGIRGSSRSAGSGVFGEGSVLFWMSPRSAIVFSGGRYATDHARGLLAGRYAAVTIRMTQRAPPSRAFPERGSALLALTPSFPPDPTGIAGSATLVVGVDRDGSARRLRVRAPGITSVRIMGDFTDWKPVALAALPDGAFDGAFPLAPGTYRFNIQLDDGEWAVPTGVTAVIDDFGGVVGILVIR